MQRISRWTPWLSLLAECVLLSQAVTAQNRSRAAEPARAVLQAPALAHAHSHNDYEQARPLLDALDNGFTSIEADVWLVNDQLLIGHSFFQLHPDVTFASEYLEPLARRVAAHAGHVYDDWSHSIQLLVDVKTDAEATYRALERALEPHRSMLTRFVDGRTEESAVTVVISGNRARSLMESQPIRYAGCDGRKEDVGSGARASLMPLVSDRWDTLFRWQGDGSMPGSERARLREFVAAAHAQGQRVRFWATPDDGPGRDAVWSELLGAGVDYVNTDDLPALRGWFEQRTPARGLAARPAPPEPDPRRIQAAGL
jgi:glycerophosphoryl diester phosphodiesterase family protein